MTSNPVEEKVQSTVQADPDNGILSFIEPFTRQSRRLAALDTTLLHVLVQNEGMGSQAYALGNRWGQWTFKDLVQSLETEPLNSVSRPEDFLKEEFVELLNSRLSYTGVGQFRITEGNSFYVIDLRCGIVSEMPDELQGPWNAILAGFFGGLFSEVSGKELVCIPLSAQPTSEKCLYALSIASKADEITKLIDDGKTESEVLASYNNNHLV